MSLCYTCKNEILHTTYALIYITIYWACTNKVFNINIEDIKILILQQLPQ